MLSYILMNLPQKQKNKKNNIKKGFCFSFFSQFLMHHLLLLLLLSLLCTQQQLLVK
jgi:hypothetical protein